MSNENGGDSEGWGVVEKKTKQNRSKQQPKFNAYLHDFPSKNWTADSYKPIGELSEVTIEDMPTFAVRPMRKNEYDIPTAIAKVQKTVQHLHITRTDDPRCDENLKYKRCFKVLLPDGPELIPDVMRRIVDMCGNPETSWTYRNIVGLSAMSHVPVVNIHVNDPAAWSTLPKALIPGGLLIH